jgi:glycosyltransferase involved in cell wall biosynthesis
LRRSLDSVARQTLREFEVLVCDDGSTDETAKVVHEYGGVLDITWSYGENFGGPARPRNRGIQLARAPYIAFLDSDDWWMPKKLERSIACLDAGADVVYHDLYVATDERQRVFWKKAVSRDLGRPAFRDLLLNGCPLCNSSVVARKALLERIGGLCEDKNLIAVEDYDAWLRISRLTESFRRIPETLGYYWRGGGNISNPQRVLENLRALEERYSSEYCELRESGDLTWLAYAKGRAHYLLGSYAAARDYLREIRWRRASPALYLKSRWMLLMMKQSAGGAG